MHQDPFLPRQLQQLMALATLILLFWISGCSVPSESVNVKASLEAPLTPWPHGAMVSAANPLAVDAGIEILELGGSAVDAANCNPLSAGLGRAPRAQVLGGGAFLLHFDRTQNQTTFLDGRESAPASATPDLFMTDDGVMMVT